ncbi:MAG: MliC family protein [bacterium]|jgi:uncharacterized membrane protein|nr:MliC family protein [Betaproteobacteria bacterium]
MDPGTLKTARAAGRPMPRTRSATALLLALVAALAGCGSLRAPSLPSLPSLPSFSRAPAQPPATVDADAAARARKAEAAGAGVPGAPARLLAEGWRCEDGRTLGTRVLPGAKAVELRIDSLRRSLPQVASGSGVRFEDADWLFWNRGAQAMLQRKPGPPVYCNEVRALSLVEDARARGITFRGQGNEPGWLLEVGPANRVLLAGMPGGPDFLQRREWPDLAAAPGPVHGSTRYTGESGGRRYTIVVLPDPCVDDMSGERFPAAVRIEVDGRRLRGCGTPIAP